MIRRVLRSRGVRKLRQNRWAMLALGVIGLYVVVALFMLATDAVEGIGQRTGGFTIKDRPVLGMLLVDKTLDRVGPNSVPGFFLRDRPERRLEHHQAYLDAVERALNAKDPEAALAELRFGSLRPADLGPDKLRELVDEGWALFDEVDEIYEQIDEAEGQSPGGDQATAPGAGEGEAPNIADLDAAVSDKIDQIEPIVRALFPIPDGLDGFLYRLKMLLGTDRQGRSILIRTVYSIKIALEVGFVTALLAVLVGSILGAAGAYFGGWVDHVVIWLFSTFSSIPSLVLLTVLAFMFTGSRFDGTLIPLYTAFSLTFWIGPCRVIRGEVLKVKELEYVQAATSIGFGRVYILLRHILPNTAYLMFINFSLLFIGAVKGEVILTFLGLGLKNGASWGIMISQSASEVIEGRFWQISAATAFMFGLVLAFNTLTDALQDAFDPKHVS